MIPDPNTSLATRMLIAVIVVATVFTVAIPAAAFAHSKKHTAHRHVLAARNQYDATRSHSARAFGFEDRNAVNANDDDWLCKTAPGFCPDYHGSNGY